MIDVFSSNSFLRRTSGSLTLADDWEASSEFPLAIAELSVLDAVLHARQESVARRSAAETRKEKGGLLPFRSSLETTNLFITDPSGGQNSSSSSSRSNTAPLHDLDGSADIISGDILMNNAPTPPQLPTVSLRKLSSTTTSTPLLLAGVEGSGDSMLAALSLAMRFDPSLREEVVKLVNRVSLPELPSEKPLSSVIVSKLEGLLRASIKSSSDLLLNEDNTSPLSLNVIDSPTSPSSAIHSPPSPPPHSSISIDLATEYVIRIMDSISSSSLIKMEDGLSDMLMRRALLLHSLICAEAARRRACALIVELSARGHAQLAVFISRWVPSCQAVFESRATNGAQVDTSVNAVIQLLKEEENWLDREHGKSWLTLTHWPLPFKVIDASPHISAIEKTTLPCPRFTLALESRINRSDLVNALAALFITQGFVESPLLGSILKHPSTIADLLVTLL